jgi:hypothetical protein
MGSNSTGARYKSDNGRDKAGDQLPVLDHTRFTVSQIHLESAFRTTQRIYGDKRGISPFGVIK